MQQVGKYQLIRQLAVGGMAEVFLARTAGPMGFEKLLVLKRILPHLAQDPSFVQMFLGEATLAARLTHPNIVQIFDFGETDGSYYLAMEYIDGPSLRTLLDDALKLGGALPPALCARIISSACEGLAFAHDFRDPATGKPLDIVHRDISPDNILLSRQGAVKVVDFGIAKAADQQHRTQTGMIKGKLAYMPPEQIRNDQLNRQVDVYALGVVLYELLTGQRPFSADTDVSLMHSIIFDAPIPAVQLQPSLPVPMLKILDRATAKDRNQRYPDCVAFQAELEEYLLSTGKPVSTQHIAQHIAQISPPVPDAPLPLQPSRNQPLTDTELRTAPSQTALTPASRPLTDTMIRSIPSESSSPHNVDLSPSLIAEKRALDIPRTQQWGSSAPSRKGGRVRAALAGLVLLAAGGGYLFWQGSSPPQPALTPPAAPTPAVTANTPPSGSTAPSEPTPTPTEPSPAPSDAVATPQPAQEDPPGEATTAQNATTGTIEFEVRPSAIVYLEGKMLGKAPPLGIVDIPPGTYTVKFVNKKLRKRVEKPITVKAGQTVFVSVDLLHEEAPAP